MVVFGLQNPLFRTDLINPQGWFVFLSRRAVGTTRLQGAGSGSGARRVRCVHVGSPSCADHSWQ